MSKRLACGASSCLTCASLISTWLPSFHGIITGTPLLTNCTSCFTFAHIPNDVRLGLSRLNMPNVINTALYSESGFRLWLMIQWIIPCLAAWTVAHAAKFGIVVTLWVLLWSWWPSEFSQWRKVLVRTAVRDRSMHLGVGSSVAGYRGSSYILWGY